MNYWFTSDTHFYHWGIIIYCGRPFKSVNEMNEKLIRNWNSVVKEDDVVFHLGDFGWKLASKKFLSRLNGDIIKIKGNHDKTSYSPIDSLDMELGGKKLCLVHDPADSFGYYNVVGHVHNDWKSIKIVNADGSKSLAVNVGVDQWNFTPISLKTLLKEFKKLEGE